LGDYEVKCIYVDRDSLVSRGLSEADLVEVPYEDMDSGEELDTIVKVIDSRAIQELMDEQDVVFSF